jgi:hypothetical protein
MSEIDALAQKEEREKKYRYISENAKPGKFIMLVPALEQYRDNPEQWCQKQQNQTLDECTA